MYVIYLLTTVTFIKTIPIMFFANPCILQYFSDLTSFSGMRSVFARYYEGILYRANGKLGQVEWYVEFFLGSSLVVVRPPSLVTLHKIHFHLTLLNCRLISIDTRLKEYFHKQR